MESERSGKREGERGEGRASRQAARQREKSQRVSVLGGGGWVFRLGWVGVAVAKGEEYQSERTLQEG